MNSACGPAAERAEAVAPLEPARLAAVTPESLVAGLAATKTLPDAASRLAASLGIDEAHILVRIQSCDCSVCKVDANAAEYPDMPVSEAISRLQPNDKFWLVVQNLTCYYYFDGKTMSPLACQKDETPEGVEP